MRNIYLSTINKCTKTIVIIIVINVESFLERHFLVGYQLTVFKNKPISCKEPVLHTTKLMDCKVLHNLLSTNQGNGSDMMTFLAGSTKINLRYLKT